MSNLRGSANLSLRIFSNLRRLGEKRESIDVLASIHDDSPLSLALGIFTFYVIIGNVIAIDKSSSGSLIRRVYRDRAVSKYTGHGHNEYERSFPRCTSSTPLVQLLHAVAL